MAELLTDYPLERDALLYLVSGDCKPKGWRVDLLVEKLSSTLEEKLLLCSCCSGLLRDACVCNGTYMCQVCIPKDIAWQPVEMNRCIVSEKMIYCPLKGRGCVWSDTVSAAVQHLADCLYFPETCPLGCVSLGGEKKGEVVRMERRHISEHVIDSCPLREVMCDFCEGVVKASEMNPHLEECEMFPIPCPNSCSREGEDGVREVKKKDLPVHLDKHCPLQKVRCAYWYHGCREEIERRLTDVHEREFMHVHFKLSMTEMKQRLDESTKLLNAATEKITAQEIQFSESLKQLNAQSTESTKKLTTLEKQHLFVSQELSEVKEKSNERIGILERQISDKDERIQSLSDIIFTYTQPPTGKLDWNVKGVRQKIRNKERTSSDPFYAGLYKCQCSVIWDYDNTGKVRVCICIMKGNFDEKLLWPIRCKCTFVIVDVINSENNLVNSYIVTEEYLEKFPECFKRPAECRNIQRFGSSSLISNTKILGEKYCKQDSITLHVSIELLPHNK